MGAVLGVGRHACRLGADPAIVNRIGEDGIDIAVEIRFLPGVRISLGKGLVDAVQNGHHMVHVRCKLRWCGDDPCACVWVSGAFRSEEHTSELQSLMRSSYAVFCLKKKKTKTTYKY